MLPVATKTYLQISIMPRRISKSRWCPKHVLYSQLTSGQYRGHLAALEGSQGPINQGSSGSICQESVIASSGGVRAKFTSFARQHVPCRSTYCLLFGAACRLIPPVLESGLPRRRPVGTACASSYHYCLQVPGGPV